MNPIHFALRRPKSVFVVLLAVVLLAFGVARPKGIDDWLQQRGLAIPLKRMGVDIFPSLNLPVIYVCQPYGGMDPAQMEGLLTNYYEYHFLYINGIHHVESKNVQGTALMKLIFHPGTNMAQAMAETINYVNRSRAMMPPGTVPPFVMRFDTGSVPVGYLVLSSGTKTIAEIQDKALFKVRPMFSALPGVSAPPPFGGSARSIVIRALPERLRAYGLAPDDIINALSAGNAISPSGNLHIGERFPSVPSNALVRDIRELGQIPLRTGAKSVYLRDIGTIEDAADITTGYALVNGRRAVYILATKRADASTMNVISEIKQALPKMQSELPDDIKVSFEFDQSPYVIRALQSLFTEGVLGACLTGLMVLVFLRDWRSALIVILNIPLAILSAIVGLWLTGQTVNLMTLGGLALAVGILVDEATVEIENIHAQLSKTTSVVLAVWKGNAVTATPRLLAMLCILAVFVPTFFMEGAPRELFAPLSLAVGFSMAASYLLSSTLVPILAISWLRPGNHLPARDNGKKSMIGRLAAISTRLFWLTTPAYLIGSGAILWWAAQQIGVEIFPTIDAGEFRLRLRAPDGAHIDTTEKIAISALDLINQEVGAHNVAISLGYVGAVPASFPINSVYQFSRGPEEAILRIAFKSGSGVDTERLKEVLRGKLRAELPNVRLSFEPADILSEVMSFGSATPIEIALRGGSMSENRAFAKRALAAMERIPELRDVQIAQVMDYPVVDLRIDREKAGLAGATVSQISRSVLAATSSSRFVAPNYWPDPKTGIGYQVQIEIPQPEMKSVEDLGSVPILNGTSSANPLLLRDVAQFTTSTLPGQYDRYNMKRELALTANISGADLGAVARSVSACMEQVQQEEDRARVELETTGAKPGRVTYELRGQIPPLRQILNGLGAGLVLALLAIYLLLAMQFQSFRLAVAPLATAPAVLVGVAAALISTGTTLNIQSFIGAIMGLGVAMANAILVVTFAEEARRAGASAFDAAVAGVAARVRPIAMTTCAMLAGMAPMAIGIGQSGQQTAPLGRAVMGGLFFATFATLAVLPAFYFGLQRRQSTQSASLHPFDPSSPHFQPNASLSLSSERE